MRWAVHKAFFVCGQRWVLGLNIWRGPYQSLKYRYSILPALTLDGIIAIDIIEGSFSTSEFACFIDGLLGRMNPYPGPNSVIEDNCQIYKSEVILEMIHEQCVLLCKYISILTKFIYLVGCTTNSYHPIRQIWIQLSLCFLWLRHIFAEIPKPSVKLCLHVIIRMYTCYWMRQCGLLVQKTHADGFIIVVICNTLQFESNTTLPQL